MRRSSWLVAAAVWLSALGACGEESPAKAPPRYRGTSAARVNHGHLRHGESSDHATPIRPSEAPAVSGPAARGSSLPSSEQLAERYARTRAISVQHGTASYYSDALAGRKTASGAPYEPQGFTAAHRSFAFGTVLRVTRSDGGQSVYVRVTDRGPFGPRGRILDLSRAAAERLGMLRAGVVTVKVEVVELGESRKPRRRRR
jgi:rare lipoprotein A